MRRVLPLALLFLGGCADAVLEGSLGTVYPIDYRDLRIRLYSGDYSFEYVLGDGSVPIRVTVDREAVIGTTLRTPIDLYEHGDITGRTSEDREIPRFSEGSIVFEQIGTEDEAVIIGDFRAKFPAGETDVLGLRGFFEGPLEVVSDPGPPPPEPPPPEM